MKILLASPEVYPFIKTGGLADVAGSLPKALKKLGAEVRVILPKYKKIDEQRFPMNYKNLKVRCQISQAIEEGEIVESGYEGIIAYLVEKDDYYYRDYLFSTPDGDYLDNAERFTFFSKSILEAMKVTGYIPDVLHCNDWETALTPVFLKTIYKDDPLLKKVATLFTIHNLGYQGVFWHYDMHLLNIGWEYFTPEALEFYGKINFLKGGIVFSDIINTVSKKYSQEIQTPEYGYGLEGVLQARKDVLFGIVNGIDYEEWDPSRDTYIPAQYSPDSLENKALCKQQLQKEFGLPVEKSVPLVGTISRLADQKGFDLIASGLEKMQSFNVQNIILGAGERKYQELFVLLSKKYPKTFSIKIAHDNRLAHLIEAGADMFLMPSRYEPCGLNQLYSLKYGTVPIVRGTGGLDDTIIDYTENPKTGTGFKFYEYTEEAMLDAIKRAIDIYKSTKTWQSLVKRDMEQDFSWERSAESYMELYRKAMEKHESR